MQDADTGFEEEGDLADDLTVEASAGDGEDSRDELLEEFRNKDKHTTMLLARLSKLAIIFGNKKATSAYGLESAAGADTKPDTLERDLRVDGLKAIVQKRIDRANSYYTALCLLLFGCIFFTTMCTQLLPGKAFQIERAVVQGFLGDLDLESKVISKKDDILDWLGTAVVGAAFQDTLCGNGKCEAPFEYAGFGRFGCPADCGKYKKTSNIVIDLADVTAASAAWGWDWSQVPRKHTPRLAYFRAPHATPKAQPLA